LTQITSIRPQLNMMFGSQRQRPVAAGGNDGDDL